MKHAIKANAQRARMEQTAAQLSAEFSAANWQPSSENFEPREFVKWHGQWFSVAGFPPGRSCVSKVCRTPEEVLLFLTEMSTPVAEPEPKAPEPAPVVETPAPHAPDPAADRIAELERQLAESEAQKGSLADELTRVSEALSAQATALENGSRSVQGARESEEAMEYGAGPAAEVASLLGEGEDLADAVERLTPGLDELLDLGDALSDSAMDDVIRSMKGEKRSSWIEKLNAEKATLRLKRETDKEDFPREKRIDRMTNLFARVGEKR